MTEELSPCPFCGGEAEFETYGGTACAVVCQSCRCGTPTMSLTDGMAAVNRWNRRAVRTCHPVDYHIDIDEGCIASTCSECGELLVNFDFEQNPPKPVGYCPCCGAKVTP